MTEDAYARKEGFPTKIVMSVLAAIVAILWFIFGYGYFSTPLPETSESPSIWLVYEGQFYSGMKGSYCWADKCVDIVFQEPAGVVDVTEGSSVGFFTNSRVKPMTVSAPVFVIDNSGKLMQVGELTSEGNDMYKVNLQKGIYILQFYANWQNLGDIGYTFKIRVN